MVKKFFLLVIVFISVFCVFHISAQSRKAKSEGLQRGDKMIDFGMKYLDVKTGQLGEETIWLGNFVGSGSRKNPKKLVLLNFYATWCKPCIKEFSFLQAMYQKYSKKGLMVLSVNFRTGGEAFEDALKISAGLVKKYNMTYPVLFDRFTNRNQTYYMGDKAVLPCLLLIDEDGIIIEKFTGEGSADLKYIEAVIKKGLGIKRKSLSI